MFLAWRSSMVFIILHWKPFLSFFVFKHSQQFLESWSCMGPKRSYPTWGRLYICLAARRYCLIYPFTPNSLKKWPFQLDNVFSSLMVFHTNLSIIYPFIPECNLHLLSKYHGLDVVLNNGNITVLRVLVLWWGLQSAARAVVQLVRWRPLKASHLSSSPSLCARHDASPGVPRKNISQSILQLFLCSTTFKRNLAIKPSIVLTCCVYVMHKEHGNAHQGALTWV